MIDITPQSTSHTSVNEVLPADCSENHYLQSPWYDRSPLFDMFCCFPFTGTTADMSSSNGPPSLSEQLFEDELKGWDELTDESWLDFKA